METKTETPNPIPTSQPLEEVDKQNFSEMVRAATLGDLVLISCVRKSDGKSVPLICALSYTPKHGKHIVPFGELSQGNPFEEYYPPDGNEDRPLEYYDPTGNWKVSPQSPKEVGEKPPTPTGEV